MGFARAMAKAGLNKGLQYTIGTNGVLLYCFIQLGVKNSIQMVLQQLVSCMAHIYCYLENCLLTNIWSKTTEKEHMKVKELKEKHKKNIQQFEEEYEQIKTKKRSSSS